MILMNYSIFPEQASTFAAKTDFLYLFLIGLSAFFIILIFTLVVGFVIRYRRTKENPIAAPTTGHLQLEIFWSVVPLVIVMGLFFWGSFLYFKMVMPPDDAMEMFVVGKQWMWKIQHPEGRREINELHVPVGKPVKLTMSSEDVIHSFYLPAFRVKQDVVPGRFTSMWFEATKIGTYRLFCAEYCGTEHSRMIGKLVVMAPSDYENWLSGKDAFEPMHVRGKKIFEKFRCDTCHVAGSAVQGPLLEDLFGSRVQLRNGKTVIADENYIRESILNPNAKMVDGYDPVMPTYEGQLSVEEVMEVLAYIKSIGLKKEAESTI